MYVPSAFAPPRERWFVRTGSDLIHAAVRNAIIRQRLRILYRELTRPMKVRLTEPVFWQGQQHQVGDVIEVPALAAGPHRSLVIPGGLQRIPQFVEMAEEIKIAPSDVAPLESVLPPVNPPATPAAAPQAAADPAVPASKGNPLAARVRALTARRAKFYDLAASILDTGEQNMAKIETDGPAVLQRTVDASHDEVTAILDLSDALKQMGNGPF